MGSLSSSISSVGVAGWKMDRRWERTWRGATNSGMRPISAGSWLPFVPARNCSRVPDARRASFPERRPGARDTSLLATLRTDLRQFAGCHRHISGRPSGRPFSLDLRVEQELHSSRACWAISRAGSSNSRRTGDHAGSFGRSGIGSGVSICSRRAVMKPVTSTKFGRVRRMDAMKGANRTRAARRGSMLRVGHRSRLAWMAVLLATGCQAVSPGAASVEFIRGGSCGIFQHWSGY